LIWQGCYEYQHFRSTERIAPPAFTPVPDVAGFKNTRAPPNLASCS